MAEAPITGGCNCGGVRFELTSPPLHASYCHCTRCQRRSGAAASPQAQVEPGSVRITRGEDLLRAWEPDDGFAKVFCSACGSALFSRPPGEREPYSVRLGAFDEDPGVRPSFRTHVSSAAIWEPIPGDGLPRYPGPKTD
ncbi:MAG: hypothetical protein QOH76_3987 [Thermoleophilaceae bacterium]|nr:hypothetical protein [Thermoleophilaceae bacterium]